MSDFLKNYKGLFGSQEDLAKVFLFCITLYFCSYVLSIYGKIFQIKLFFFKLAGICMFASFFFILLFLPQKIKNIILKFFIIVSAFLFLVDLVCFWIFQTPLSSPMIATIIETNPQEAKDFFFTYYSHQILLILCLTIAIMLLFYKFLGKIPSHRKFSLFFLFSTLIGFIFCGVNGYKFFIQKNECKHNLDLSFITLFRVSCELKNAYSSLANRLDLKKYTQDFSPSLLRRGGGNNITKIVLVIGESTQRGHMGLYGYDKPTSEFLSHIPSKNLILFTDVISPYAQTTLSFRKIITFQNYENEAKKEWFKYDNLINIFNSIKYQTIWISNQDIGSEVASLGSKSIFVSELKDWWEESFVDGKILPYITQEKKKNQKQFFVIHLMGAHASYTNRYPKEFEFFKYPVISKERFIQRYDNAVRYNSYILQQIFKDFEDEDSLVIFLSDHGEEMMEKDGKFAGHSDDRLSRFMVEIPLIFYVSDTFIQKHPDLYKKFQQAKNLPYMSDDLIHTILDIAGIENKNFDPSRSIINPNFNSKRKRITGAYKQDYDKELKQQKSPYKY